MSNSRTRKAEPKRPPRAKSITVPRDRDLDAPPRRRRESPPSAADVNPRDEDYTDREKPLVAGSREARLLHENPPRAKGELGVGTAGDAARPIKPGIHGKPLPPRGNL